MGNSASQFEFPNLVSKRDTNVQVRVSQLGSPGWGAGEAKPQWQDLAQQVSPTLLPSASLSLERQVDDGTVGHVVVSQRVGILG